MDSIWSIRKIMNAKDVLVSQILETKEALEIRFSEYSKLVHTTQDIIFFLH